MCSFCSTRQSQRGSQHKLRRCGIIVPGAHHGTRRPQAASRDFALREQTFEKGGYLCLPHVISRRANKWRRYVFALISRVPGINSAVVGNPLIAGIAEEGNAGYRASSHRGSFRCCRETVAAARSSYHSVAKDVVGKSIRCVELVL